MIVLNFTLILAALIYVSLAFRDKTREKQPAVFDPRLKTWRRDLTPHETRLYNEMRRHWAKQAKVTYKKINQYDKRKSTTA
jgi:hypothetical protein